MRRKRPQIAERVLHGSGAVAIGRILEPANGGGAGADSRRVQVVRVGYVHVQQEWSGLRFFAANISRAAKACSRNSTYFPASRTWNIGTIAGVFATMCCPLPCVVMCQELPLGSFTVPWRSP